MITDTDAMAAAVLRRLDAFLDEPDDDFDAIADAAFPTDADAQAFLAEVGVEVTGLAGAICAQVDGVPAGQLRALISAARSPPPARSARGPRAPGGRAPR